MLHRPTFLYLLVLILTLPIACGSGDPFTPPNSKGGTSYLGMDFGSHVSSLIVFSRQYETQVGPNRDLFAMFPDGSHIRRLTDTDADEDYPAFSPDGLSLAYVANGERSGWGNHDVFRMVSKSKKIQLTDTGWEFNNLSTSWGAGVIVSSRHNMLIGAPYDFIGIQKLSPTGDWEDFVQTDFIGNYTPCVSRDGKMIAFCARPGCPSQEDPGCTGTLQLFIIGLGAEKPEQLTNFGGSPQDPIDILNPAFDPSGKRLVFQTTYWDDNWEIGFLYIDEPEKLYRLTDNPAEDIEPCFDPTQSWIAFASNRDGNFEIYKTWDIHSAMEIAMTENNPTRLTNTSEDEHNPDWSIEYPQLID